MDKLEIAQKYIQDYIDHLYDFRSLIKQERKNKKDRDMVVNMISDKIAELETFLSICREEIKE